MHKSRILALLAVVVVLTGCGVVGLTGSGNVVTQEEAITGFDGLDISHGFQVDVVQGDSFAVVVRVDDNLLDEVRIAKDGSALKIGLRPGITYNLKDATLEADVTMPELTGAGLSGGSHLDGRVETGDLTLDLSGGSHVTLSGSAGNLTVDASGGSHAKLAGLEVADAGVDASGGSHVTVNPSGRLDADASGGSQVRYVGSPTLGTLDTSGSSSIKEE